MIVSPQGSLDQVRPGLTRTSGDGRQLGIQSGGAFRSIAWLWALGLCVDSGEVTPDFFARLLKSLIAHGRHIERYSYYFSPNHAPDRRGSGAVLPEPGAAGAEPRRGWRTWGCRYWLDQATKQGAVDGVYFEQSSYYHRSRRTSIRISSRWRGPTAA